MGTRALGPTRDLVQRGLVTQIPVHNDWLNDQFFDRFERYLESLPSNELRTRQGRIDTEFDRIHLDKGIANVGTTLSSLGLARGAQHPWLEVERATAGDYMAALALAVTSDEFPSGIGFGGNASNASATIRVPVTDQAHSLLPLLQPIAGQVGTLVDLVTGQSMVEDLQAVVLSRILPVPSDPIDPDVLVEFKTHNADLLGPFRRHLEASIDNMLNLQPALQTRAIERLVEETRETVNEIQDRMGRSILGRIVRSDIVAALGALIPPIGAVNALVRYFHGPDVTSPLAYGALAQVDLLG